MGLLTSGDLDTADSIARLILGDRYYSTPGSRVDEDDLIIIYQRRKTDSFQSWTPVAPSENSGVTSIQVLRDETPEGPPQVVAADNVDTTGEDDPPKYLEMSSYARHHFATEFRYILDPGFLDSQTRSAVERVVSREVMNLQRKRYRYRTDRDELEAMARRDRDVNDASARLYSQLVSALSKHEVMVRDLSALPTGATGGIALGGVYGGR